MSTRFVSLHRAGRRGARRGLGVPGLAWLVLTAGPHAASAGPPLITDDPNTIGRGNVELIVRGEVAHRGGSTDLGGPVLDATLGVVDRIDATLTVGHFHGFEPDEVPARDAVLAPGVKWQFLDREHLRASIAPYTGFRVSAPGELVVALPLQLELDGLGAGFVGLDAELAWGHELPDVWDVGVYTGWAPAGDGRLLAEVVLRGDRQGEMLDAIASLGIDWPLRGPIRLLASLGTGLASAGVPRTTVRGFLGLQWDLSLGR